MDSARILESFLVSRSRLEDVISESQFARLGDPELYRELCAQRQKTVDKVKFNVHHELDIPLEDVADAEPDGSLESLVQSLLEVEQTAVRQEQVLDDKIAECIGDLKRLLETVNQLAQHDELDAADDSLRDIHKIVDNGL